MASFFTRALDKITPWRRGGEVQRDQQVAQKKKKKEDENTGGSGLSVGVARPGQQIAVDQPKIAVQRPEDLFAGLSNNLKLHGAPNPILKPQKTPDTDPTAVPAPGAVVKPTIQPQRITNVTTAPNQPLRVPNSNAVVTREPDAKVEVDKKAEAVSKFNNAGVLGRLPRAIAGTGVNVGGGLIGVAKGIAETPAMVANVPNLFRMGVAKVTGNEAALEGASRAAENNRVANALSRFVRPLTDRLTSAELKSDELSGRIIPTQTEATKNLAKVAANLLPVDAVAAGISKGSKIRRAAKADRIEQAIEEAAGGAGVVGEGATALGEVSNRVRIPVAQDIPITQVNDIPVNQIADEGFNIPVRDDNVNRPIIRENSGDASVATPNPLITRMAADAREQAIRDAAFDQAKTAMPSNPAIEGMLPRAPQSPFKITDTAVVRNAQDDAIDGYADMLRNVGEGNGTQLVPDGQGGYIRTSNNYRAPGVGSDKMSKAAWREEAIKQLQAGKAEGSFQKAFDDAANPEVQSLISKGDTTAEAPIGRPIQVKESTSIPVRDETNVPTGLPEKPGTVRATVKTAPMEAKSEAAANAPVVSSPVALPAEVQNVLDNPKQFSKRELDSARNQRKLARAMAKTKEDTAAAIDRIDATKSPDVPQGEGFAPTEEFGRGKRGNAYQKASQGAEAQAGRTEMADRSVDNLLEEIGSKESFTPGDRRRISAAMENMAKADPENAEVRGILKKLQSQSRTELGQALAMIPKVIRKSSTSDTIVGRWESRIAKALDNPSKMSDADLADVNKATESFTLARDNAEKLNEQFKRTGSEADFKAWEKAYTAARKADDDAKFTELSVAKRVLKGEKGAHVNKVIDDLKKESNVNTMDLVTANMLASTGTGFRNTFGTELAGIENRLLANTRAKITNKLFDENVGGFDRSGARYGRKVGMVDLVTDAKRRAEVGGKNPLEWAKNWSTTINSGGQSSLESQVYSRLAKYYKNDLSKQGLSGKELDMRMRHAMLTDPDEMASTYLDSAMKSSGLSGLFEKGQTIEKAVADLVGNKTDSKMLQGASKLIMRLAVGFPTATGNFLAQSGKRLALGLPSYIEAGYKTFAKGDKAAGAMAFDRAMKETGSGGAMLALGAMLGSQGRVSGAYPDDPEERARWEREGISENSIKIGDAWYPIPQGAGMFGLPILTGAAMGRDGAQGVKEMYSPKNLAKLLPTDQIQGFLNMASGNGAPQDFKNFVASSVRASTPVGALFNQIAKSTDDTKNDTTTKSLGANIMDQIMSGIPGVNNKANIPDKVDNDGNVIKNANPLEIAFGASSAVQGGGEARTAEIDQKNADAVATLDKYGLLKDKNMDGVLQEKGLEAYKKLQQGKKLDESDVKALKEGLVKGVSSEGTDTAYLERGEYDTNLAVLKLKRDLMNEDKTSKPSSLKDVDTAIKRGEIYKDAEVPYDMIKNYQSIGVDEWRKMGIPPGDEDYDPETYDPEMYQKLWALDDRMSKEGVSYMKGKPDKRKYTVKEAKGAGKRGAASSLSSDFGTLKAGSFAPNVQQYESIDQKSGSIPIIRTVRSNIVHKISSS